MDIDRYLAEHGATWARLESLSAKARRVRTLAPGELEELVSLYQRVSAHLSFVRTHLPDPAIVARLTGLVATANGIIYGTRPRTLRTIGRFFTVTFPAAVWHGWRFVLVAAVLLVGPALAVGIWLGNSDQAVKATAPAAVREAYVNEDFETYYSSEPATEFGTKVFVNNVGVAIAAFAVGIGLCVPTAYILVNNGANVGLAAGLFADVDRLDKFFGLIVPHGLLELSAVVIAGAAGLRLGWALIAPGDRTRAQALAREGRRAVMIVLGLVLVFGVAGFIEGFITGRGYPTWFRVGLGVAVAAAFWLYVVVQGRAAVAQGFTGLPGDERTVERENRRARERALLATAARPSHV